ncbi:unnamed protein product, partial [Rotaria magnacalcarata]
VQIQTNDNSFIRTTTAEVTIVDNNIYQYVSVMSTPNPLLYVHLVNLSYSAQLEMSAEVLIGGGFKNLIILSPPAAAAGSLKKH